MSSTDQIFQNSGKRSVNDVSPSFPNKRVEHHRPGLVKDLDNEGVSEDIIDREEDPRFYGDDVDDSLQSKVLTYIESKEKDNDEDPVKNLPLMKRIISKFLKAKSINTELREKYSSEPLKFFESEEELHDRIKELIILFDINLYGELVDEKEFCYALISLLDHDNLDIAIEAMSVIIDLISLKTEDEDDSLEDDLEAYSERIEFLQYLETCGLFSCIERYLQRLSEDPVKYKGEEKIVLDFFYSFTGQLINSLFSNQPVMNYLLLKLQETPELITESKTTCIMILLNIVTDPSLSTKLITGDQNGIELLLQLASNYIYEDPQSYDNDKTFAKCIFDILQVVSEQLPDLFIESEGPELMVKLLKDSNWAVYPALEVLQAILKINGYPAVTLIQFGGLKPLFKKFQAGSKDRIIISILSNLLRWLELDSPERIRLVGKFAEKDYKPIKLLMKIRNKTSTEIDNIRKKFNNKNDNSQQESNTESNLELIADLETAGVDKQNNIDIIIGWLTIESPAIKNDIIKLIPTYNDIINSLKHYITELELLLKAQEETPIMTQKEVDLLKMDLEMVQSIVQQ